jgi:uncharacterized protein (TIGR04255 family)
LPDYARPPVVETILSVQFEPLPKLKNVHLGLFWNSLDRGEWPTVKAEAPPVEPQFERFTKTADWGKLGIQFQVLTTVPVRIQVENKDRDRLIQAQNGRLMFNWLGIKGATYPHYERVREGFVRVYEEFMRFLRTEGLGQLRPDQWEVTYLNHIPKGTVWNSPADWRFFKPLTSVPTIEGLIQGESFSGEWHFVIPENRGRLHANWQHSKREVPKEEEVVVLNLTARGPLEPESADLADVVTGLNLGHETIVRSFRELTSRDANDYWGLKDDKDTAG